MADHAIPFPVGAHVPLVGQPFALRSVWVPVHATLDCRCGGDDVVVTIVASQPAACPSCGKMFAVAYNPVAGKLEMQIGVPNAQVPS